MADIKKIKINGVYVLLKDESARQALDNKVDKVSGKGLSTNDYTTTEKNKLAGIESGAQVNKVNSVAGKTGAVVLDKADVGLGNVDNTSDLNKPISTDTQVALDGKVDKAEGKGLSTNDYTNADKTKLQGVESGAQVNVQSDWNAVSGDAQILNKPTLGTASSKDVGTSAGNVPVLDVNGKIDAAVLPAIAVSETFTASSEAAMLALDAQNGDVCVRTDQSMTYILVATPASTLSNWKLLEHPADAVSSVNGKMGVVTINASDVGLGNVDNTSDLNKPISTATQAALDGKVDKETGKGLSTEDFTSAEKTKLSGIEAGAQVNTVTSVAGKTGAVTLTKDDVGLGNVDNTSDLDKPISTATQAALDELEDEMEEASVTITDSSMSKVSGISDGLALPPASQMEMLSLRGNTIAWNQMVKNGDFSNDTSNWNRDGSAWYVTNNTLTIVSDGQYANIYQPFAPTTGHKVLFFCYVKAQSSCKVRAYHGSDGKDIFVSETISANQRIFLCGIATMTSVTNYLQVGVTDGSLASGQTLEISNVAVIDLTIPYPTDTPTSVSDPRVQWCINYALEHPEFASKLVNVGLTAYETEGINQWNEEWELGDINSNNGNTYPDNTRIRSKYDSPVEVIGGSVYYRKSPYPLTLYFYDSNDNYIKEDSGSVGNNDTFTVPNNAKYVRFVVSPSYGTTYNHDICINVSNSAINGQYFPYVKHTYPLSYNGKSAGSVQDEKLANGKEITRVGSYTFTGNEVWFLRASGTAGDVYYASSVLDSDKLSKPDLLGKVICSNGYSNVYGVYGGSALGIGFDNSACYICIPSGAHPNTIFASGTECNYELVTPTETDGDPLPNAIAVYQGGTEWQINDGAPATITKNYDISIKDQVLTNVKVDARQEEEIEELRQADLKTLYNLGEYDTVDTSNSEYDLITRATGIVDLGTLDWTYDPSNNQFYSNIIDSAKSGHGVAVSCPLYDFDTREYIQYQNPHTRGFYDKRFYIIDENYANNVSGLIAHLQGVYAQYQLETPYTEKVIKNRPLDTLDQNGSMFVRKEWEKGLNLFTTSNYVSTRSENVTCVMNGSELNFSNISGADPYSYRTFKGLKVGKKYTASIVCDVTLQYWVCGASGNLDQNNPYTFIASATEIELGFEFYSAEGSTCNVKVMLVEGSNPYPYQPYNGDIVHQKELEGTLLWQNGNPDASFGAQTITLSESLFNFKYLIICSKLFYEQEVLRIDKFKVLSVSYAPPMAISTVTSDGGVIIRFITVDTATTLNVGEGYNNGVGGDKEHMCPIAIYGTNVL